MATSILGTSVIRVEDPALLTGDASFIDNLAVDGLLTLTFVRSTVAFGTILSIDMTEALAVPGIVGIFSAEDLGLEDQTGFMELHPALKRPPLAHGTVHFVGDPVLAIVAHTKAQAADAANAVIIDYDVFPAQVDMEAALHADAPPQYAALSSNLASGFADHRSSTVLADADVVVRARMLNQRIAVAPLEGNAIAVLPGDDGRGHDLTVYVSTQMPHMFHRMAAKAVGHDRDKLRVITPNVGGGFGGKAGMIAEHAAAIAVAKKIDLPVRWVESRTENMQAMAHSRGQVQYVEFGFTRDGHITGARCRMVSDAGAYGGFGGALVLGGTRRMAQGVYEIPKLAFEAAVAVTTTTPMGAYRGAGRPEAASFVERIMDLAADELGIDAAEIRRRNFVSPEAFPYDTRTGVTYDCGRYADSLDAALAAADYPALLADQTARRAGNDQMQLGIGLCTYVEITGAPGSEYGAVDIEADGSATIRVGTSGHGQGHPTAFAMIVSDRLGIPMDRIRFVQSDTADVPRGGGTGGSRSLQLGGTAVSHAAASVLDQAKNLAAQLLEADPADIVVTEDGRVGVAGVPSSAVTWAELSATSQETTGEPLRAGLDVTTTGATFPFGTHVAVVEVDMETGETRLIRHIAVDDCGRILNPMIVAGQQHGGIASGVSQALYEQIVYDNAGNLLTSTFAEYAFPSAAEFPSFEASNIETPTYLNSLGAKGIGESGTVGATPAVQNAVVDAVSHLGVRHIDMPCTPERVWRAITDARSGHMVDPWTEPPAFFATLPIPNAPAEDGPDI